MRQPLFASPEAWPLVLLAPLAWLLLRRAWLARAERLRELGARAPRLVEGSAGGAWTRAALVAAAALAGALAVLEPVGAAQAGLARSGVDVVLCADVSRSMLAADATPSRLGAARAAIRDLAGRAQGDRLALVAYAGEARLVVPLTRDLESFALLAGRVDVESVPRGGTDVGAALDVALAALRGAGPGAAIVLLADGEDFEGRALAAAERCRRAGVAVHCLGFGSPHGAKIVLRDASGERFLRDRTGRDVVTALDEASLRAIAAKGGGAYAAAASSSSLADLYEERIVPRARALRADDDAATRTPLFQWPLAVALALWILDLCRFDRGRR